jgi:DNA-binding NarL/FixJ family response regulator
LVEDELVLAGYEVLGPVATQADAVKAAVEGNPDLVVMDIRLEAGDGIDAAIEIKERTGVRAVFATAFGDGPTLARAELAMPVGWVPKPYGPSELLTAIRQALHGA